VRILNVIGPSAPASFVMSSLVVHNSVPGRGDFTCCQLGHRRNGHHIPCDKRYLRRVMTSLVHACVEHAWRVGDANRARYVLCYAEKYLEGLPAASDCVLASVDLRAFREALHWPKVDTQPPRAVRCGARRPREWTLLHWAALAGHAAIVSELVDQEDGLETLNARAAGMPEFAVDAGMTPIHFASHAASGSFEAAAVLLDARADPAVRSSKGYGPVHTNAILGSVQQVEAWLDRFPESARERDKVIGMTPLHYGVSGHSPCADRLEILRRHGADVHGASYLLGPGSVLFVACQNFNPDVVAVRALLEARCEAQLEARPGNRRWKAICFVADKVARASRSLGRPPGNLVNLLSSIEGSTPLHVAVSESGNLELVRLLLGARASASHKNRAGRSALQEAERVYGGDPPPLLIELLRGSAAVPRSPLAKEDASDTSSDFYSI